MAPHFSAIDERFGELFAFRVEKQETSFFSYLISGGSNGSHTAVCAFKRRAKCALSASLYIILVIEK
jgi:hypothetical protein